MNVDGINLTHFKRIEMQQRANAERLERIEAKLDQLVEQKRGPGRPRKDEAA